MAYKKALSVGSRSPTASSYLVGDTMSKLKIPRFKELPIPLRTKQRLSMDRRRDLLSSTMASMRLRMPKADWVAFVPSRVDFFWKGQDILFRALSGLPGRRKIHLIVSGWGQNYDDAKKMVSGDAQVTFLPCAVSKPILYNFHQAVDFVVDQFFTGAYGTAAIEAMSCAVPVLMRIDERPYLERGWEPPPVLNARNEADIVKILTGIFAGQIDLEQRGRLARDWVKRIHGEESVVLRLVDLFRAALSHMA